MNARNSFRQCLHPTPLGFALGILVMAFSLALWFWFIVQVGGSPGASKRERRPPPMAWSAAALTSPRAT